MFDMRYGGDVYMGSIRAGASSGNLEMTLDGRDGMIVPGVLADGTPNTKKITSQAYWNGLSSNNVTEAYMYDATNIRLRELSLGYNFPRTMLAKTPFTAARLSFVARNLFMIYSKAKGFDPEAAYTSGNAQGIEYNRNAGYGEQRFVLIKPVNGKEQYKKYSVCYCRGDKVYYYKFLCGFCELFAVVANSCARADTVCRYTERSEHGKV